MPSCGEDTFLHTSQPPQFSRINFSGDIRGHVDGRFTTFGDIVVGDGQAIGFCGDFNI